MKNQTVILLIVAGACGLVTMLGVRQYLAKQNQKEEVPKVKVLVASGPIKQGVLLSEQNTEFITVETKTCPEGVVTDLEQIRERALKVPRGQGDWILVSQLTEKGAVGAVVGIPNGMRVVTIPVDATTIHSGMLQPGNRIDLLLTYRERDPNDGLQKEKTIPLMEYIEVFAVDSQKFGVDSTGENAKARNISLLVDIEQMLLLSTAKKKGTISTALRSSEDVESIKIAEVTEENLSGAKPGTEVNRTSTLDMQSESQGGFVLPEPDIMSQLQAEIENGPPRSAPAVEDTDDSNEFWTMAIHQFGTVRVEKVNLKSDEPIDTTGSLKPQPASPRPLPVPGTGNVPTLPGLDSPVPGSDKGGSGNNGGSDKSGLEQLEEAASGLLDDLF